MQIDTLILDDIFDAWSKLKDIRKAQAFSSTSVSLTIFKVEARLDDDQQRLTCKYHHQHQSFHSFSYLKELNDELEEQESFFLHIQHSKQQDYRKAHLALQRDRDLDGSMHIV